MSVDASLRQQLPTTAPDSVDVAQHVVHLFTCPTYQEAGILVPDIEARIASGEKKYGTRLKTHNGRNAVLDLYQEVLDGINYSMQNVLEKAPLGSKAVEPYSQLFNELTGLAIRVKNLLLAQEVENVVVSQSAG